MSLTDDMVKAKRCHIAVGTPGRIRALINAKNIDAKSTRLFVLDEADKLMESAFRSVWQYRLCSFKFEVIGKSRFKKLRFKKESRFKKYCWCNRFFST